MGTSSLATQLWGLKHQVDNEGRYRAETTDRLYRLLDDARSSPRDMSSSVGSFSLAAENENKKLRMELESVRQEREAAVTRLKESEELAVWLRKKYDEEILKLRTELDSERQLRDAEAAEVTRFLMTEIEDLAAQLKQAKARNAEDVEAGFQRSCNSHA